MTITNDDQLVIKKLSKLQNVPARDDKKAASTRAKYLSEMNTITSMNPIATAVSISPKQRLNEWIKNLRNFPLRKERYPMFTTLATVITVLALAFGGAGATVYAAQESLPNDLLYPVKLVSEQFRMNISTQTQSQFQLALEFANRRIGEVAALSSNGEVIPQEVMARLQNEFTNAFKLAAGMSDDELTPALLKLQATIRQQQQIMAKLSAPENEAILARIREMLQVQNRVCETGLSDPLMFRIRVRQHQNGELIPPTEPSANPGNGNSQGNQGQGTGISNGGNSGANTGSPSGSGNSEPGSGICTDCVPGQDGTGPGPGPDAGYGEGSDDATPPQDGTGVGPGPNEDPGAGSDTNLEPGNDNSNQNESGEPDNENNNPGNGNSEDEDTDNGNPNNSETTNPSTPGSGGSEDGGGGKGKP